MAIVIMIDLNNYKEELKHEFCRDTHRFIRFEVCQEIYGYKTDGECMERDSSLKDKLNVSNYKTCDYFTVLAKQPHTPKQPHVPIEQLNFVEFTDLNRKLHEIERSVEQIRQLSHPNKVFLKQTKDRLTTDLILDQPIEILQKVQGTLQLIEKIQNSQGQISNCPAILQNKSRVENLYIVYPKELNQATETSSASLLARIINISKSKIRENFGKDILKKIKYLDLKNFEESLRV